MGYLRFVLLGLCILSAFASDADPTPNPPFSEGDVRFIKPANFLPKVDGSLLPKGAYVAHPGILLGPPDEKGDARLLVVSHTHPPPASGEHLREANDYIDKDVQSQFKFDVKKGKSSLVNLIPAVANQEHIILKEDRYPKKIEPTHMERLKKDSDDAVRAKLQAKHQEAEHQAELAQQKAASAKASTSKRGRNESPEPEISPEDKQGESKRLRLESFSSGNFKSRLNSANAPSGSLRNSPIPRVKEGTNPSRHNSRSPLRGSSPKARSRSLRNSPIPRVTEGANPSRHNSRSPLRGSSSKARGRSLSRNSPIPRIKEGSNPSRHNSKSPQRGRSPNASTTKSRGRSGSPGSSPRKGGKTASTRSPSRQGPHSSKGSRSPNSPHSKASRS